MVQISNEIRRHVEMNNAGMQASHERRKEMAAYEDFQPLTDIQERTHAESLLILNLRKIPQRTDIIDLIRKTKCSPKVPPLEAIVVFERELESFVKNECGGSHSIFAALWNSLIGNHEFEEAFYEAYWTMFDPIFDGCSALESDRSTIYLARHGKSVFDSKVMKVGRRTPNRNTAEGTTLVKKNAREFAKMLAGNILAGDPEVFVTILTSLSPNTARELGPIFADALSDYGVRHSDPAAHPVNESQDFGLWTGLEKEMEKEIVAVSGTDPKLLRDPLFMYPGGDIFAIFLAKYVALFKELDDKETYLLGTHSSSLKALLMGYRARMHSIQPDIIALQSHKENQGCIIGIETSDMGFFSPYSASIGESNPIPVFTQPEHPRHAVQLKIQRTAEVRNITLDIQNRAIGKTLNTLENRGYRILSMNVVS